jgi:hypothetical protein
MVLGCAEEEVVMVGVQGSVQCDLIATSTGSSMCTSSLISTMMTAMAMVSRIVLVMKAPGEGRGL